MQNAAKAMMPNSVKCLVSVLILFSIASKFTARKTGSFLIAKTKKEEPTPPMQIDKTAVNIIRIVLYIFGFLIIIHPILYCFLFAF